MNESNLNNLSKLTRVLGADRLLDQKDVEQIRDILVAVLANNKQELEDLTEDTKGAVEALLKKIVDEHDTYLEKTKQIAQEAKSSATEAMAELKATQKTFEEVKKLAQGVMECKPEDGEDADEEMIIQEVLAKIKLPEYKEVVLDDGTEIVAKINELPVNEDNQIDAKHIKNLPEFKNGRWSGITKGAVIKLIEESGAAGVTLKVDGTENIEQGTLDLIAGSGITITDNGDGTVTFTATGGGGGAVDSVNGQTGVVVLDADDISDTSTTHKFTTAAEITKLAGIETGADVTDTANVTAAGALMDSELASITDVKALNQSVINGSSPVFGTANMTDASNKRFMSDAQETKLDAITGTNTGDQTSIVGITGTKAQFDTAVTDGNFLYVGDMTQYTDELAQDAVGGIMTDSAEIDFTYNDATPSITASIVAGSIDETKLDTSTNASLDLADSALQSSAIGSSIQGYDADLAAIAALTASNDDILQRKAGAWTNRTVTQVKTDLTLVKGDVGLGNVDNTSDATKDAATATLTNKTIQAGKIDYVIEPATDDTFEGEMTNDVLAGDTIAQWDLTYLDSTSGRWEFADADAVATSGGVLLSLSAEAKTDGQAMNVVLRGVVRNDGWTWSGAGKPLYVSTTAGGMTETAPSGAADVIRIVGYTLSDDAIYFNPDNAYVVHA